MHKEFQHKFLLASGSDILMFIADDVALAVIFYLFLNIRQTITHGDKSYGQAHGQASGPGSALQAITHSCRRSCSLSTRSCRLSYLLVAAINAFIQPINAGCYFSPTCAWWSGAFTTHCTDANRREIMPKQHSVTCLVQ